MLYCLLILYYKALGGMFTHFKQHTTGPLANIMEYILFTYRNMYF